MLVKGSKVRTGCVTCKSVFLPDPKFFIVTILISLIAYRIRRIKCDEGKPSCIKCQSTGRVCDGYTTAKVERKCSKQISAPLLYFPRILLPKSSGNRQEQRYLSFFQEKSAAAFAGYFDSAFWECLVLQVSVSVPAVRHAVIALASLHESYGNNQLFDFDSSLGHPTLNFALQQYAKSVSHLNKYLVAENTPSIGVVLICCVLFIAFESLQGNSDSTACHLLNGSKILRDWEGSKNSTNSTIHQDEIRPVFQQLNVQAKSLLDINVQLFDSRAPGTIEMPDSFTNLQEARNFLYIHLDYAFDLIQTTEAYVSSFHSQNEILDEKSAIEIIVAEEKMFLFSPSRSAGCLAQAYKKRTRIENLLYEWSLIFDKFLSQSSVKMSTRDVCAAILLKIHYICCWVLLKTCHSHDECVFDEYISYFEKVTILSQALIETSTSDKHGTKLWFEMGVIAPLYFTASRCREPTIRRRAVQLLELRGRDGARDAEGARAVAERMIALEEADLVTIKEAKDIPEYARIHVLKACIKMEKRHVILSCYNKNASSGGRPNFREEHIKW